MIPLGVLLILYAVMSVVWPLFGKQLLLMTWIRFLPPVGQWVVRGVLVALGAFLIVRAVLRRRGPRT
jgi:hypothetical protein